MPSGTRFRVSPIKEMTHESDGAVVISISGDQADSVDDLPRVAASSPPDSPIVFSISQAYQNRAYDKEEMPMQDYYRRRDSAVSEKSLPDPETVERVPKADHYRIAVPDSAPGALATRPTLLELHAAGLDRLVSFEEPIGARDGYEVIKNTHRIM